MPLIPPTNLDVPWNGIQNTFEIPDLETIGCAEQQLLFFLYAHGANLYTLLEEYVKVPYYKFLHGCNDLLSQLNNKQITIEMFREQCNELREPWELETANILKKYLLPEESEQLCEQYNECLKTTFTLVNNAMFEDDLTIRNT